MTDQPNALPTRPEELSSLHQGRATLYQALFELLRMPPRAEMLSAVAAMLDSQAAGLCCVPELSAALRGADLETARAEFGQLFASAKPLVAMRCKRPNCGVRDSAFTAADTLSGSERVSELHVISVLAERAAQAFSAGKLPVAAAFSDAQAQLLSFHAGACLADLAEEIESGSAKLYATVGKVLRCLIAQDMKLLVRTDP